MLGELGAQWILLETEYPQGLVSVTQGPGDQAVICGSSYVLISTDDGANWAWDLAQDQLAQPIYGDWYAYHFFDDQAGIAVGTNALDSRYVILQTFDGGASWFIRLTAPGTPQPVGLVAVDFPDALTGYSVGTNGGMFKTVNGGFDWVPIETGPWGASDLWEVEFWDADHGLIRTSDAVFRTEDGGQTWSSCWAGDVFGISVLPNGIVYAVGAEQLGWSNDQGVDWNYVPIPFQYANRIQALAEDTLYLGTGNGIYHSFNNGLSWEKEAGIDDAVIDLYFPGDGSAFAVTPTDVYRNADASGPGFPYVTFALTTTQVCDSTSISLTASWSDPSWELEWTADGTPIGTGTDVNVWFNIDANPVQIALMASNGTNVGTVTENIMVAVQEAPLLDAGADVDQCYEGGAVLHATGGGEYLWSPSQWLDDPTSATPVAVVPTTTVFTVETTVGLCTAQDSVTVNVVPQMPEDPWITTYPLAIPFADQDQDGMRLIFFDAFRGFLSMGGKRIYRTLNSGDSWQATNFLSEYRILDLTMRSPTTGYCALGGYCFYRTADGWNTFDQVNFVPPESGADMVRVTFESDSVGVGAFKDVFEDWFLALTSDGGVTWQTTWTGSGSIRVNDLVRTSSDTLFAVVSNGVLRSTDGGQQWTSVLGFGWAIPASERYLVRSGSDVLCMGGRYLSEDGGSTWEPLNGENLYAMMFLNPDTAYALRTTNGELLRSVNSGRCWQTMAPTEGWPCVMASTPARTAHIMSLDYDIDDGLRLDRLVANALPVLDFTTSLSHLCASDSVDVFNASVLYTGFDWYLDGALWSTADTPPPASISGTGVHEIKLVGHYGFQTDSLTRMITLTDPLVADAPDILPLGPAFCAQWDSVLVVADPPANANNLEWQIYQNSTLEWTTVFGHSDDTLNVTWPILYYAEQYISFRVRGVDAGGCAGPWSSEADVIPEYATNLLGLYTPGLPCVRQGVRDSIVIFNDPPAPTYEWSISPAEAVTLEQEAYGASWTWNGGWDADEVTITVVGHFLCRDDTSSWTLPVSDVVYLTQAFDSLVTYPGQALTLIATPNVSQFGNAEWYRNGVGVQEGPGDYHIAAMTAADTGLYEWGAGFSFCGDMRVPVAYVSMDAVGLTEPSGSGQILLLAPVPAIEQLVVTLVRTEACVLEIQDALGRRIWQGRVQRSIPEQVDVSTWPNGAYVIQWRDAHRAGSASFVVQHL